MNIRNMLGEAARQDIKAFQEVLEKSQKLQGAGQKPLPSVSQLVPEQLRKVAEALEKDPPEQAEPGKKDSSTAEKSGAQAEKDGSTAEKSGAQAEKDGSTAEKSGAPADKATDKLQQESAAAE